MASCAMILPLALGFVIVYHIRRGSASLSPPRQTILRRVRLSDVV
jgi:hypothetical protein